MKFSIKDLVTFTEEILNGKLPFWWHWYRYQHRCYKNFILYFKFFSNNSFAVKHTRRSPVSFQSTVKRTYPVENLLVSVSIKRKFTADIISGIFQNFKAHKESYYRALTKFSKDLDKFS